MRSVRLLLFFSVFGVLWGGCSNATVAPGPAGEVIVVGAEPGPGGLPGFVINHGSASGPAIPFTCAALVCYQTVQLRNTGIACANDINGQTEVFIAPASAPNLLRSSSSGYLITGNPPLLPGQTVSVNVTIPEQPSTDYVIMLVLNWTSSSCG